MEADETVLRNSPIAPYLQDIVLIGEGGFASVFKAYDKLLDRTVAVKVLHSTMIGNEVAASRFLREAQALAKMRHPRIVRIFSFGRTSTGCPYIVMEFIEGTRLADKVQTDSHLDVQTVQTTFSAVLEAVGAMHTAGFVHRDLSSANIMITKDGDAKIFDFGFVKHIAREDGQKLTKTRQVCGTISYCSPEVCLGEPADKRSDIYSLGCVLYYMLTGRPPFIADTVEECMIKHLKSEPVPTYAFRNDNVCYPKLEQILGRCLNKQPKDRYQSIGDLLTDIDDPTTITPAATESLRSSATTNPKLAFVAAALLLVTVATALVLIANGRQYNEEPVAPARQIRALRTDILSILDRPRERSTANPGMPASLSTKQRAELFKKELQLVKLLQNERSRTQAQALQEIDSECLSGLERAACCCSTRSDAGSILVLMLPLMQCKSWSDKESQRTADLWMRCTKQSISENPETAELQKLILSFNELLRHDANPNITNIILVYLSGLERGSSPAHQTLLPKRIALERQRGPSDELAMMLIDQAENSSLTPGESKENWRQVREIIDRTPKSTEFQRAAVMIRYAEAQLANDHRALLHYASHAKQLLEKQKTHSAYVHALTLCARAYRGLNLNEKAANEWHSIGEIYANNGSANDAAIAMFECLSNRALQPDPKPALFCREGETALHYIATHNISRQTETYVWCCSLLINMASQQAMADYVNRMQAEATKFLLDHHAPLHLCGLLTSRAEWAARNNQFAIANDCAIRAIRMLNGDAQSSTNAPALPDPLRPDALRDLEQVTLCGKLSRILTACGNDNAAVKTYVMFFEAGKRLHAPASDLASLTYSILPSYDRLAETRAATVMLFEATKYDQFKDFGLISLLCHRLAQADEPLRSLVLPSLENRSFPGIKSGQLVVYYWNLSNLFLHQHDRNARSKFLLYHFRSLELELASPEKNLTRAQCIQFCFYCMELTNLQEQGRAILNKFEAQITDNDFDELATMVAAYQATENSARAEAYLTRLERGATRVRPEQRSEYYVRLANLQTTSQKPERALASYRLALEFAGSNETQLAVGYTNAIRGWGLYNTFENSQCEKIVDSATAFFLSHSNVPRSAEVFEVIELLADLQRAKGAVFIADKLETACQKLAKAPANSDAIVRLFCLAELVQRDLRKGQYANAYDQLTKLNLRNDSEQDGSRVRLMQFMASTCRAQGRLQEEIYWDKKILAHLKVMLPLDLDCYRDFELADAYLLNNQVSQCEKVLAEIRKQVMLMADTERRRELMFKLLVREVESQGYASSSKNSAELELLLPKVRVKYPDLILWYMTRKAEYALLTEQYELATDRFTAALEQSNRYASKTNCIGFRRRVFSGLGLCKWQTGNYQGARESFATGSKLLQLQADPDWKPTDRYLSKLFLALNQHRYQELKPLLANWQQQMITVPASQKNSCAHFLSLASEMAKSQQQLQIALSIESLARQLAPVYASGLGKEKTVPPDKP